VHGAAGGDFRRILLAWLAASRRLDLIFFIILRELSASILLYSVATRCCPSGDAHVTEGKAGQVSVIALVMLGWSSSSASASAAGAHASGWS